MLANISTTVQCRQEQKAEQESAHESFRNRRSEAAPAAELMNHTQVYTASVPYIIHTAAGLRRAVTFLESGCSIYMPF